MTSGAKLLLASAARQRAALNSLRALSPVLESCRFVSLAMNTTQSKKRYSVKLNKEGDSTVTAVAKENSGMAVLGGVYTALGVNTEEILQLISESSSALAETRAKFSAAA